MTADDEQVPIADEPPEAGLPTEADSEEEQIPTGPFWPGWVVTAVFIVILIFVAFMFSPLWFGYFGPRAAAYSAIVIDRPGLYYVRMTREHAVTETWPHLIVYRAEYDNGEGHHLVRVTVWRSSRWRPWEAGPPDHIEQ